MRRAVGVRASIRSSILAIESVVDMGGSDTEADARKRQALSGPCVLAVAAESCPQNFAAGFGRFRQICLPRLSIGAATHPCVGRAATVGLRVLLRDPRRIGLQGPVWPRGFRITETAGSRCPGTADAAGTPAGPANPVERVRIAEAPASAEGGL
jgi:hypothetical protein